MRDETELKEPPPIVVTLLGISIDVIAVPTNTFVDIDVSKLPDSNVTVASFEQPSKASGPILVTLFGISMVVISVLPRNALLGIVNSPEGFSKVNVVRAEQPRKASSSIVVTLFGTSKELRPDSWNAPWPIVASVEGD